MSTNIPLTYRIDHEVGPEAKDLTPIQVEEISAQQSIFYCRCLFYLLRQAAISEPHDPRFNQLMFLHRARRHHNDGSSTERRSVQACREPGELEDKPSENKVIP